VRGGYGASVGPLVASVLPLAALLGVIVAATRPLGSDTTVLVVAVLAAAGIVLTAAGFAAARARRR
jgi:hypothetical protein